MNDAPIVQKEQTNTLQGIIPYARHTRQIGVWLRFENYYGRRRDDARAATFAHNVVGMRLSLDKLADLGGQSGTI